MADELDNICARLMDTVRPELEMQIRAGAGRFLELCESPIEVMLISAVSLTMYMERWGHQPWGLDPEKVAADPARYMLSTVTPQYEWCGYRIDFAFFLAGQGAAALFVECDGHAFHERTPEQAERDRKRDRTAVEAGIPVLRFTGREIYRDPFACAAQILRFLVDRHLDLHHDQAGQ